MFTSVFSLKLALIFPWLEENIKDWEMGLLEDLYIKISKGYLFLMNEILIGIENAHSRLSNNEDIIK